MSIHSPQFWLFLLAVVIVYYATPSRVRWLVLLVASYYFYASYDRRYILLIFVPTAITYLCALGIERAERPRTKKLYLFSTLFAALGLLAVFKYLKFLEPLLSAIRNSLTGGQFDFVGMLLLPIGISFFIFKLLSYILDVYSQRIPAEKHPGFFALYVSFFPQLLAGPIERARTFLPQLRSRIGLEPENISSGMALIAWGLFKKLVVADRLGMYVNEIWKHPEEQHLHLIVAVYFYAMQIYCDFSGYTDLANGLTQMLGFNKVENFHAPYSSRSIPEFWTRWHITLSFWFRDYIFLPLAYGIARRIKSDRIFFVRTEFWGYAISTMITMGLCGLWHGAAWTFIVWGLMHGIFLIASYATKNWRKEVIEWTHLQSYPSIHGFLSTIFTFHLLCISLILFRAPTLTAVWNHFADLDFEMPAHGWSVVLFNLLLIILFFTGEYIARHREQFVLVYRAPRPVKIAAFAFFLCLMAIFAVNTENEFIYFRF
ncbi:MAG: hypothetical protein C5B54_08080 [Acidobacteria bacterium]|nr:MAG: hypothetical protein C5B54_08080 [Acidobacteriota bacterium]